MSKEKWNRKYAEKGLVWPEAPSSVVVEETKELPPGEALDLAAGEGRHAFYLARQGWRVRAVDFSEVAVEKGSRLAEGSGLEVEWVAADLTGYAMPAERFDLVLLMYLHMPWNELTEVIRRAAQAVRSGGRFLLVGHDSSNAGRGAGGPQDPALLYTAEDVAPLLEGFVIEKACSFERDLEHEGEQLQSDTTGPTAIDCMVRARRK